MRHLRSARAVLILLDRAVDLAGALQHPWTYQALVHDLLDLRMNRISIEVCCCAAPHPRQVPPAPFSVLTVR